MTDAPVLVEMPVSHILMFWNPGSHDWHWTWQQEYRAIMRHRHTPVILRRILEEGVGFADEFSPVLLGNDGRVWDGHHRICLAVQLKIPTLMVELTPARTDLGVKGEEGVRGEDGIRGPRAVPVDGVENR